MKIYAVIPVRRDGTSTCYLYETQKEAKAAFDDEVNFDKIAKQKANHLRKIEVYEVDIWFKQMNIFSLLSGGKRIEFSSQLVIEPFGVYDAS